MIFVAIERLPQLGYFRPFAAVQCLGPMLEHDSMLIFINKPTTEDDADDEKKTQIQTLPRGRGR